jgi:hypothetical protein
LHSFKLTKLFYRLNPIAQILVWHVFSSFPMALKMKLPAKWSLVLSKNLLRDKNQTHP